MNECPRYFVQILVAFISGGVTALAGIAVAYISHRLSLNRERLGRRDDALHRLMVEIERQRHLLNGEYRRPDLRELEFYRQSKRPLADAVYGCISRLGKNGGASVRGAWERYCSVDENSLNPRSRMANAVKSYFKGDSASYAERLNALLDGLDAAAKREIGDHP